MLNRRDLIARASAVAALTPFGARADVTLLNVSYDPTRELYKAIDAALPAGAADHSIAVGSDGNLWFNDQGYSKIGQITTAGAITEFPTGLPANSIQAITSGPDGALWFSAGYDKLIGRITTAGAVSVGIGKNEFRM